MISGGEGEVVPGVVSLGADPRRWGDAAAQWQPRCYLWLLRSISSQQGQEVMNCRE